MFPMNTASRALLAVPIAGLLLGAATGCAHGYRQGYYDDRDDRGDRDARYQTEGRYRDDDRGRYQNASGDVASLAHELSHQARALAHAASGRYGRRGHAESDLEGLAKSFAERASELSDQVENREADARDVARRVEKLNNLARNMSGRLRDANVSEQAFAEWNRILETLHRLNSVTVGRGSRWSDERRD